MPEHSLTEFIYAEFGKPLGDLLLVGHGHIEAGRKESFEFNAPRGEDAARTWLVEVTARALPRDIEPLILAALLKFLLGRVDLDDPEYVSGTFEFNMDNLLRELARDGWTGVSAKEVHDTIVKYTRLSYTLRELVRKTFGPPTKSRARGTYTFLSGFTYITEREGDGTGPMRLVDRVKINEEFVEGLKRGEIIFAGMKLGKRLPLHMSASSL
jgi:hypothetical protein